MSITLKQKNSGRVWNGTKVSSPQKNVGEKTGSGMTLTQRPQKAVQTSGAQAPASTSRDWSFFEQGRITPASRAAVSQDFGGIRIPSANRTPSGSIDTETLDRYAAQKKQENQSILERVGKTVSGAGKTYLGGLVNLGGQAASAQQRIQSEMTDENIRVWESEIQNWTNSLNNWRADGTLTKDEEDYLTGLIQENQKKIDIYRLAQEARGGARDASYQLADEVSFSGAKDIQSAKEGLGPVGSFVVDTGVALGQQAVDFGIAAATGGSALLPMGIRSFGSGSQQARQEGADEGQAALYGIASAALETVTEQIGNIGISSKFFGGGALDDVMAGMVSSLEKRAKTAAGRAVLNRIGTAGMAFLSEGFEEFVSGVSSPLLERAIYSDDPINFGEVLGDALYDFAVGGAVGGILGGTFGGRTSANQMESQQTERVSNVVQEEPAQQIQDEEVQPEQQDQQTAREAAILRILEENGVTGTPANRQAQGVAALIDGGELSSHRADEIRKSRAAQAAYTQITGETIDTTGRPAEVRARIKQMALDKAAERNAQNAVETIPTQAPVDNTAQEAIESPVTPVTSMGTVDTNQAETPPVIQYTLSPASDLDTISQRVSNINLVDRMAQDSQVLGEAGRAAAMTRYDGTTDPSGYYAGFMQAYNDGMNGKRNRQNSVLTKEQYNQAYNAGRTDSRAGLTREGAGLVRNASAVKLRDAGTIDALAKKLGVTVVAEETIFSPDGRKSGANGYIKGREIHIALDAEDPSMVVFKHEVTHYLQEKSAKSYQAFRDYAVQAMGEDEVRRVQDLYRRGGVELTWDGAMDEVAANYTEKLLTDEEAVRRLIRDDRNLAQKILDAIRGLVQKVTGQEGAKLRQAEKLWTEMFREIAGQEQADRGTMEVRYSVQNLTPDERSAILSYKSSESYKVNAKLREGIALTDMEQAMVDELDRALEKLPKVQGTVYRTLNFDEVFDPEGEFSSFMELHQEGGFAYYDSYTSTSKEKDGYPLADETKYGITIEILSNSARDLANFGNNFESEALFPRGSEFDIVKVTTDKNGRPYIYMKEMQDNAQRNEPDYDTEKRGVAMREVPKAHSAHSDLQSVSERYSGGDQVWESNLQESGTEGTSEQEVTRFSLNQENQRLRELNQYLREEISDPSVVRTSRNGVKKLASRLVSEYDSTVDKSYISAQLLSLYDFIANGKDASGNELTWTEVSRRAKEIAQDILSGAVAQGNPLYEEYADVRSYVKQQAIVVPKDSRGDFEQFGGWGEFRKRNAGRMKLMNDGLPSDVFYQELSSQWPELFPEDIANPADQMIHTAEVLQYLDAVYENPYQQEMDVYTRYLADEILESFYEVPQRTTYAQRQQLRQTKQAIRYEKRIDSLRQRQKERIADLRAQGRDRIKQAVAEQREESAKKLDALKRKYQGKEAATRDRREAAATRAKIQRHVKKLSQLLLRPSDKSHVPEALKKPVAALLESINLESQYTVDPKTGKRKKNGGGDPTKRTQAFQELRKVYAEIAGKGEDMVIDPSLFGSEADGIKGAFDAVIDMRDTRLSDMTQEQLETVWKVVRAVEHSITTAGRILSKTKYASTQDWARAVEQDTASRRSKRTLTEIGALKSLENPYTFFSHYGEAGHAVYRMLRNAQDKQQLMVDRIAQEVGKITDPKSVEQLEKTVHTFTTERGDSLTLSTAQVMELYELTKRKQAHEHLLKGGIVQPEIKSSKIRRGTNAVLLSEGDLANIIKVLSEEEMKLADALQGLTSGILADYGNEASMTAYGYKKFTGTDYWPIRTAKEGVHSSSENNQNNTRSIKNIGLSKPTVPHASNALDIRGIFTTFSSHAGDMVDYAAWLVPMEDANRLFNYEYRDGHGNPTGRYVKGLLDRVGGAGSQEYWSRLMDNIQNGISAPWMTL